MRSFSGSCLRVPQALYLTPLLLFVLLAGSYYWAHLTANRFLLKYSKSRSESLVDIVVLQLEQFVFERTKDLVHLSTIKNHTDGSEFKTRFLKDAQGIVARESTYAAIFYNNEFGVQEFSTNNDSALGIAALNFKYETGMLENAVGKEVREKKLTKAVLSRIIATSTGKEILVLFIPIYGQNQDSYVLEGTIGGALYQDKMIKSIVDGSVPDSNYFEIKLGSEVLYAATNSKLPDDPLYLKAGVSKVFTSALRKWTVSIYPSQFGGELLELYQSNNRRLLINVSIALLSSGLLALALIAFHYALQNHRMMMQSEKRYRRLAENAPNLIFRFDIVANRFDYISPAINSLFGYEEHLVSDKKSLLEKLVYPDDKAKLILFWENFKNGQQPPSEVEFRMLHAHSNKYHWVVLRTVVARGEDGRLFELEGIVSDINNLKITVEEKEVLIKELERKNRELERLLYTLSHELKTPLITIQGFIGYLEKEAYAGDFIGLHEDIERIRTATETMRRMLHDLIEYIRAGKDVGDLERIDFKMIVSEVAEKMNNQLQSVGTVVELQGLMPEIIGNRQSIIEMVENLLENANKFMGNQENSKIKIGTKKIDSKTFFYVSDNGIGIEKKYQNKIFGLFDKLDSSTDGTGVGLPLVKRLVEAHNGWIRVESEGIGKGTTFLFTLPLAESMSNESLNSTQKDEAR